MVKKKLTETRVPKEPTYTENIDNKHINTDSSQREIKEPEVTEDTAAMESSSGEKKQEKGLHDKTVPKEKILEEKLAEIQDKHLRLSAEFDNYRKRTLREKIEMTKYAGENLIGKLLPLMDDFDRALKHMEKTNDCDSAKEGLKLIYLKFYDFLTQHGVKEIDMSDDTFNVDLHEAVAKIPVAEKEKKGKIVDIVLKGYYLQDKVIRYSKVVVGE